MVERRQQSLLKDETSITAKVLHYFEPTDVDEVELQTGDVVKDIKQDKSGWWEGEVNGRRGLFPASYVMVIENRSLQDKQQRSNTCNKCSELCSGNFCSNCGTQLRRILASPSSKYKEVITQQPFSMQKLELVEIIGNINNDEINSQNSSTKATQTVFSETAGNESNNSNNTNNNNNTTNTYKNKFELFDEDVNHPLSALKLDELGDLGMRIDNRLIYDFEKLGVTICEIGDGLHPHIKRQIPIELNEKGITQEEWFKWMHSLNEIQLLSPSEGGLKLLYCFPGLCVQALCCSMFCPLSMNHCLSWLPGCYGDWYEALRNWMSRVNKTLNEHGMHAKLLTYKPYTLAPKSKLYDARLRHRSRDTIYSYEMTFLVIALTPEESKRLKFELWDHGVDDWSTAGIGRCV